MGRYVSIWLRHLTTDRFITRYPELAKVPFVLAAPQRGRMIIAASNAMAETAGIRPGLVLADARAVLPSLTVMDDRPELAGKLLSALAEWCLRYSPEVAIDPPDGLLLEVTGCAHLWGGELTYLKDIVMKLQQKGYDARGAMAPTIGTAWAVARFGTISHIIEAGAQMEALLPLPPAALRMETGIVERLQKLGLTQIGSFIKMPRTALRRRFGQQLLTRLDQALGTEVEPLQLIRPVEPYQERLPCLEPIRTATGIEIALRKLLESLCLRLEREGMGLRRCMLKGFRIDGNVQEIGIGTNRPTRNVEHLYKLFELKLETIEPALGIELFLLEAPVVEVLPASIEKLWRNMGDTDNTKVAELLDRIAVKIGPGCIHRYVPAEHHWPERSFQESASLTEVPPVPWPTDLPRPVHLLADPVPIQVTVPLPDYPPIQFIFKGQLHKVRKADGPERIEQEWWIADGLHRDYYCVEDTEGRRYWVFRLGHYDHEDHEWFLHGFFA